jgi:hypothetical protein
MHVHERLLRAARRNLKDGGEARQGELTDLIRAYDASCELSELPDPGRKLYHRMKAEKLEKRIREFAGVTDAKIEAITLPNKKENRFAISDAP